MRNVLFVDDELRVLDALRRMLRPVREQWRMSFASSADEALQVLEGSPQDAVVTDLRMPGVDGAELLTEVRRRYPMTVRLTLSGHADEGLWAKSAAVAHQSLLKPCEADTLIAAVQRTLDVRDTVGDPELRARICAMTALPSIPSLYVELMEALHSPSASLQELSAIIGKDVAMTAKVLQLVNSAFFGAGRELTSVADAVAYLGVDTICTLALSGAVFARFEHCPARRFSITELWRHSLSTGAVAQRIAGLEQAPRKIVGECLLAGILHDVGKLVLATSAPERYDEAREMADFRQWSEGEAEKKVLGVTHGQAGAYLLWLWGIPLNITEAVAFHLSPGGRGAGPLVPLTAVHAANALLHEMQGGACSELDMDYLAGAGVASRIESWREIAVATTVAAG